MAYVRVLRTYRFMDKDPVIDEVRTIVQDEGLMKRLKDVADLSSLSLTTIDNWFNGVTKRPHNASIMAVMSSLGYKRTWEQERELNVDEELPLARAWLKRERAKAKAAREQVDAPAKRKKRKVKARKAA